MRYPVVFLPSPGLPAGAWERWVELFTAHGGTATAPAALRWSPQGRSVLVGYGPGGLLALLLAGQEGIAGVIAIDVAAVPVAPTGPEDPDQNPVLLVITDQGPSLITGPGWRAVAESCLSWLDAHEL
ncbi:MAG TPA: hypothetical protein VGI21_05185 [Streptosporangiaceae bacterium]